MSSPLISFNLDTVTNPIKVASDYTNTVVDSFWAGPYQTIADTFNKSSPTLQDAQNLWTAVNTLIEGAVNGIDTTTGQVAASSTPSQNRAYLTNDMATSLNQLIKSLESVGFNLNTAPTSADEAAVLGQISAWQDLGNVGLTTTLLQMGNAVDTNRSLQSLIELEYVKNGNDQLSSNLSDLYQALQLTSNILNTLQEAQTLHNNIQAATRNVNNSDASNFYFPSLPPPDSTITTIDPTTLTQSPTVTNNLYDFPNLGYATISLPNVANSTININTLYQEALNAAGLNSPSNVIDQLNNAINQYNTDKAKGAVTGSDLATLATAIDNYNNALNTPVNVSFDPNSDSGTRTITDSQGNSVTLDFSSSSNLVSASALDIMNFVLAHYNSTHTSSPQLPQMEAFNKIMGVDSSGNQVTATTISQIENDVNYFSVKAFDNVTSDSSSPLPAVGKFNNVADYQDAYKNAMAAAFQTPLGVQINITAQDVTKFIQIQNQLVQYKAQLTNINPKAPLIQDIDTILKNMGQVPGQEHIIPDSGLTIGTDPNNPTNRLLFWNLDGYDTTDATNSGQNQTNLTQAVTSAQGLNDQQKQKLQQGLYLFEQFYKSASTILQTISQLITKMGQNIKG